MLVCMKKDAHVCTSAGPGGFEARSFEGYFTTSSMKGLVEPCAAPAVERCVGWNNMEGVTQCGSPYAGQMCSACAKQHYLRPDQTCKPCPTDAASTTPQKVALFGLILAVSAAGIAIVLVLAGIKKAEIFPAVPDVHTRMHAFAPAFGMLTHTQVKDYVVWFVQSAQLLASASGSTAAHLPALVISIYEYVCLFIHPRSATLIPMVYWHAGC